MLASLAWAAPPKAAKQKAKAPPRAAAAAQTAPAQAQRWAKSLGLRAQAGQLLMVHFYGEAMNPRSRAFREFVTLIRGQEVGGLIILNRVRSGVARKAEPMAMAAFLNRMQRASKLPLIVGGDFERGASMRIAATTQFPHAMAFGAAGDLEATRLLGRVTAREARALGVHWVFAPDADVNNNPDNPIINIRSFSEDPRVVASHVTAFIEGAHSDKSKRVLVTVKHFPGHGDTATDTHVGLAKITAGKERMNAVELAPFRAAIQAGVDGVMTGHLAVPAYEPEDIPATVSKRVLTDLLRDELKFKGLIVTDAMDMQGLTKLYSPGEAAVRAIEAGADLLLVPPDPKTAIDAIAAAVKSGRLTRKRIEESVTRILAAKIQLGLNRQRLVDIAKIDELLDDPDDEALADRVASEAVTAVKNENSALPLANPENACYFALGSGRFSVLGRDFIDEVRKRAPHAKTALLDPNLPESEFESHASAAASCSTLVVAAYVVSAAYAGQVGLPGNYPGFMQRLMAAQKPLVLISFGNPYLLKAYPGVAAYLTTYSTATPSEMAGIKALFGEIPVRGHLPVTIPGAAPFGSGLSIPAAR